MRTPRLYVALVAVTAMSGASCSSSTPTPDPPDGRENPTVRGAEADGPDADRKGKGFVWEVADGTDFAEVRGASSKVAAAVALDAAATTLLLSRLPVITAEDADQQAFALREGSKPPPRTGKTIDAPFPPPGKPAVPDVKPDPPTVRRYQPEGDVPVAPRLSITFSNAMVPVTSHDTLAKEAVPVTLAPEIEGNWRWVGTKTLFFDPTGRAPMATHYKANVKAGTKDVHGQALDKPVSWTFSTPPASMTSTRPRGDGVALEPTFVMVFDQRVDAAEIMKHTTVTGGGQAVRVRELTADEKKEVHELSNEDLKGRVVAFKAEAKLAKDTSHVITVAKGTPSAEGPRLTEAAQTYDFRTYGPFRVKEHRCGWRDCRPTQPWRIVFTNAVDADAFDESQVSVSPKVEGFQVDLHGHAMHLRGLTRGRTTYKVTLSKTLTDTFGQTLGEDVELEFEVGPSQKMMGAPDSGFVVLDPTAKKKRFSIYTTNYDEFDLTLRKVTPADWLAYNDFVRNRWRRDDPPPPPGQVVLEKRMPTHGVDDELTQVAIDLGPALDGGFGQVLLIAKPVGADEEWQERSHTVTAWIQATNIGLDAFNDHSELIAWATQLTDGKPLGGVEITLSPQGDKVTTGASGLATLKLPGAAPVRQTLVARKGKDLAFLPDNFNTWSSSGQWVRRDDKDGVRWMVFDDRTLYRPGETVSLKGFVRVVDPGEKGDVGLLPAGALTSVSYKVVGPRGNELGKGTAKVNRLGGFHTRFELPKTPNLGHARVMFETGLSQAKYGGANYQHGFQIQEFRRPEFEVSASASQGPHLVGGEAAMTVKAAYFAGGALPNADVNWRVTSRPGSFTPPNHGEFIFGEWVPWWISRHDGAEQRTQHFAGQTDASGTHRVVLRFKEVDPPRTMTMTGNAEVTDVNRQGWAASASLVVHPASHYVGLKTERRFVQPKDPVVVDAVVANLDGRRLEGSKVAMEMVRIEWKRTKKKGWHQIEVDPVTCEVTSAKDPVSCTFKPLKGGSHRIRARISDDEGRPNLTSMTVWVAGGKRPPTKKLEKEAVELIPEKRDFAPGETAKILVQAPFWPADGVLTIERSGIVETKHFHMDGPSTTLEIPVEEWMVPNFHVNVHLSGSAARTDDDGDMKEGVPRRPAYAAGHIGLRVPPTMRRLAVAVAPAHPKTEPGAETAVALTVTDAHGKAVSGAEIAVVIVDEAVLALTGYKLPDPIGLFYSQRGGGAWRRHMRERLLVASLDDLLAKAGQDMDDAKSAERSEEAPMAAGAAPPAPMMARRTMSKKAPGGPPSKAVPIKVRKDFNALAVFAPEVHTDQSGRATVKVKLPDNLTRYRVMAVAVGGTNHFGSGEAAITARLPLMVRMSPPRFLNFGDRFELPVVIQNQTDEAMEVHVAVRATNATLTAGEGRKVKVAANDRVEVRFPASAEMAGTARFQAGASAGSWSDAAEVKLPVWTPATTEAFATYGEIDKGGTVQPVKTPGEVVTQFGGLDVTTSSTQLQALTDAVLYLVSYPFECSEQIASRIMALAALKDVLTAFKAAGLPSADEMKASVADDLKKLRGMQNGDGGWGFWRRGMRSWPFLTVHVTHALSRVKDKGFEVPEQMLREGHNYLKHIERHFPSTYGPHIRRVITAYALYVRLRLQDRDAAKARSIIKEEGGAKNAGLEMLGWLYPVLSGAQGFEGDIEAIRKRLNNSIVETAGAGHFTTSYSDGAHLILHSQRRVDGLLLEGLIGDQPKSDLIPKLVRGLLGHRTKGRWGSTQENAWVLLGLDRYFNTYENVEPNFVARVWLGDGFAGEHKFKGRTTERHHIHIPMAHIAKTEGSQPLTLTKTGPGRMYYRLGMRYAPKSLRLEPADHGFYVERTYEAIDDPKDVTKDHDGRWVVKAGAKVRVKITMVAESRRYHVALVDPMPAGFEALNPALKGTAPVDPPSSSGSKGGRLSRHWWWGPWYEHTNLRDERAEAFTSLLWGGVYEYTYVARATTPGEFVVPPSKAEEMYHPETFGRGGSDFVIVKE